MPNWSEILEEVKKAGNAHDVVRRKYLSEIYDLTGRNVIVYYSGWLQAVGSGQSISYHLSVNDADKNGLMAVIHHMDRTKGLDLILHTPGGGVAATESLVGYLRSMFDDYRTIVALLLYPWVSFGLGVVVGGCRGRVVRGR